MGRKKMNESDKKQNLTVKLSPELIKRLQAVKESRAIGLSKIFELCLQLPITLKSLETLEKFETEDGKD